MDLSALIFVALAVAWAVYLVPKALRHHEEDAVSRSIDGFSDRLRVLARREPVSSTKAELVPTGRRADADASRTDPPATPPPAPRAEPTDLTDDELRRRRRARQTAARRAAERRRRVFSTLLLAVIVVAALAIGKVFSPAWIAAPLVLLATWLVACRLMVRAERAARPAVVRKRRRTLADEAMAAEDAALAAGAATEIDVTDTASIPAVSAEIADDAAPNADDSQRWAPVDVPLPTYVAKAPAGRTVRTIDLDSTGVWSSGRNEADSQLAREADARRAADADAEPGVERRAAGS